MEGIEEDARQGRVRQGPHRADIRFMAGTRSASRVLSRGEAKLLVYSLALAQARYVRQRTGRAPLLLLDDLPSELDQTSLGRVLDGVRSSQLQTFITCIDDDGLPLGAAARQRFHVEQGQIRQVV